jgi:CheY-like chemotaxis protein
VSVAATKVLVIDDEETARDLLTRYLTGEGYAVLAASSGEEGIEIARAIRPDVITLDVMMPGQDGWAVLARLKGDPSLSSVPVVLVTIVDGADMGFALGATDYVPKPVDRERLAGALRKACPSVTGGHVLVVDDDAETRTMLRRMLEKGGWRVSEAPDGGAGLEAMREVGPDAVLLDLMMPEMDGFQVLDEVLASDRLRSIPIVVVTAKDLSADERLRLDRQVTRVMEKGRYRKDELLSHVRSLIERSISEPPPEP